MKGMKMASHHVRDVRDDKCRNFFLIPVFVKQQLTNKETVCETFWGNVLSEWWDEKISTLCVLSTDLEKGHG